MSRISVVRDRGRDARLPGPQARLLKQINQGFTDAWWAHYHKLVEKRQDCLLSAPEHRELIRLTDQLEKREVKRLQALLKLAKLRKQSLTQLMKALRLTGLSGGTVEGGWADDLKPDDDINTIVEVITDEGLIGVGSAMTSKALVAAAVRLLRPLLIGERADEPMRVTEKLRQSTFWQGRGGAVEHAISGIDIALWDLFGKITNQPVARLLGGYYRDKIKPYGSMLFAEPESLREKLLQALARGFKAIKLGWRPFGRRDSKTDELLVRTARDTVGPDVELMVDAGGSEQFWPHGYKWALRTAKMLADYDVVWFEEALPPDDLEGFIELRRHAPVPIATGEVLTRRQSFRPFIERHAVDIIQPDCTKCGGLTESWRIGWLAYEHNIMLVPHGWNTAIGLAADLHLTAALPIARNVEFLTPSPYLDELVTEPFKPDAEGFLHTPTKPGLGIELNREALKKYGI